ncbi:MAG: hypothetical protein ACOC9T_00305 [Myxococcota bacterium]
MTRGKRVRAQDHFPYLGDGPGGAGDEEFLQALGEIGLLEEDEEANGADST